MNFLHSCITCKYHTPSEDHADSGTCRRYPPMMVAESNPGDFGEGGTSVIISMFPLVEGGDWCGEYQAQTPFISNEG